MINLQLEQNNIGCDYIVGDIHGAFGKLSNVLKDIGFNYETDRLICTGDLVDRGAESEACLGWLGKSWFFSVQGNHERLLIDAYRTGDYDLHFQNGGSWFYSLQQDERIQYVDTLGALPITIEVLGKSGDKCGVIHAECTNNDWEQTKSYLSDWYRPVVDRAMWARTKINRGDESVVGGVELLFVGHTIVDKPKTLGNVVYMDTLGWHDSGYFSLYNLTNGVFVNN